MGACTLAYEGRPRNPGQMGRGGVDAVLLEPRLFGSVIGAAVYRLAGFGLLQGRIAAMLFCAIQIAAVYVLLRRMFGPTAAIAIAALSAMDPWTFLVGRTFREEVFVAALLWLSWALLWAASVRRARWLGLAGGVCAGLACWAHANAVVYTLAALFAVIAACGLRCLRGGWLAWAILGLAVGLAPYAGYVLYEQNATGVRLLDQVVRRADAFARPAGEMITTEWRRWANFLRLPARAPLAALYAWGLGWGLVRGGRNDRLLAFLVLFSALMMPWWQSVSTGRYLVVLVPALTALVWRSLPRCTTSAPDDRGRNGPCLAGRRAGTWVTPTLLVIYAGMSLAPTAVVFHDHRNADYERWMARVAEHIPRDGRVMAHTMYWTGLYDRRFISSIPPFFSDWPDEADAVAHIERYRPEWLIQSSHLFSSVGGVGPRPQDLRATPFGRACETLAARVPAQVVTEFYDRDFGAVRVWKVDWPEPSPPGSEP